MATRQFSELIMSKQTLIRTYNNELYIVSTSEIKEVNLCDCYNDNGQVIGHYDAGDYSLENSESGMLSDMIDRGCPVFGDSFADIELDSDLTISNAEELGLSDRESEINAFIKSYEEENSCYNTVKAIQYWDGHNNRSLIIEDLEVNGTAEIVDDNQAREILEEYQSIEPGEYNHGFNYVQGEKYQYKFTQYPCFYECEVITDQTI